jgi:hypothetical protein
MGRTKVKENKFSWEGRGGGGVGWGGGGEIRGRKIELNLEASRFVGQLLVSGRNHSECT